VFVLLALTAPPEPLPVEYHVVVPLDSWSWIVAELNVLVLLLMPALNPPRVDEAVIPSAATAARDATSADLCLPMRRIAVLPLSMGLITASTPFADTPVPVAPGERSGYGSPKKTIDGAKDSIDPYHP